MATKKKQTRRPAKKRAAPRPYRQQPESLRLRSMAASFTVNDLDKSIAWYRDVLGFIVGERWEEGGDRKSTRLNSSHDQISYAVFCLKKKIKTSERRHT